MKIIVTKEEIKQLVAYKMGLSVNDFTLVISEPRVRKSAVNELDELNKKLAEAGVFNHTGLVFLPEKKIQAIKTVRQYYYDNGRDCGLFAGKTIVEEWDKFVEFCQKNGFVMNPDLIPWRK